METRKTKLGGGPSRHADEHGQPGVDVQEPGPMEEAEKLEVQVMETRKTKLGGTIPTR